MTNLRQKITNIRKRRKQVKDTHMSKRNGYEKYVASTDSNMLPKASNF